MMKLMKKTGKNRNGGFTLVELIVVLVILGILAAIMVPALLGWIDKAKNQDAILECRNVVQAAQGEMAELYAKNSEMNLKQAINDNSSRDNILKLAGTEDGSINANIDVNENAIISYLEYQTGRGINVLFDRRESPSYKIVDDFNKRGTNAQEHYDSLTEKMKKDGLMDADIGTITDKLNGLVTGAQENKNVCKALQNYFRDNFGTNGKYPELTDKEKVLLKELVRNYGNNKINDVSELDRDLYWMPVVSKEGEVLLLAQKKSDKTGDAMASVIYYKGEYYCHYNGSSKIDSAYVNDEKNDLKGKELFSTETDLLNNERWLQVGS